MQDWFSAHWFSLDTLRHLEWTNQAYLYALPGVPLLFGLRWLFHSRSRQRLSVAFPVRNLRAGWIETLRYLPALWMTVGLGLVLVALARPQQVSQQVERNSEGIDIVLALDISESMQEADLLPNRLEAARRVAQRFVRGRQHDRLALVVFAGDAFTLCPLTTDYDLLQESINSLSASLIRTAGTAIGSALGVSINRLRDSRAKSKVVILLSDGDNTAGSLDPITAAQLARAYGIRVYTIGLGRTRKALADSLRTVDEGTLARLAELGQGQAFRATDAQALGVIFNRIDRLERAQVKTTYYRQVRDIYGVYLRWAIVFLLGAFLLKVTFIGNALED